MGTRDEPRHRCLGCGGSCQGVRVRVLPDELERIARLGGELGVADPLDGDRLRFDDGRCAFLDEAQRCRLHAVYGADAKPLICRQYPLVIVDTGDERRAGVDPGCYTAFRTRDAEPLSIEGAVHRVLLPPDQRGVERAMLAALGRLRTIAAALHAISPPGSPPGDGLPAGFATRWVDLLATAPLAPLVARSDVGPSMRAALAPIVARFAANPSPGDWPALSPELDAWGLECARRMVFLRLCADLPPLAVAALALGGAVACAWTDPSAEAFPRALAGWCRAIRAPAFRHALLPSPERLYWLMTGAPPG